MASFDVSFKPSVHKDFRRLPKTVVERVMKRIDKFRVEPFPHGVEKLEDAERLYRVRVGDYRIVYEVDAHAAKIVIVYVRHRRDVYRTL
jgi:mRNA interferase RelE/StbE